MTRPILPTYFALHGLTTIEQMHEEKSRKQGETHHRLTDCHPGNCNIEHAMNQDALMPDAHLK